MATSTPAITAEQMRWFRLQRGGLVTPFASAEACAAAHFGIQAQILPAAGLSLWNRTAVLSEQRIADLLYTERTLVKLWGQRNTLHLYACADWPLLHAARSVNLTWWERHLGEADRAQHEQLIAQLVDLLQTRETIGRTDLRLANLDLQDEHFSAWGGIFADLVRRGHACHAGRVGNEGLFAHRQRWAPHLVWDPPSADEANVAVMRRYFALYGPATMHDFAYWRAVTLAQVRPWQAALQDELSEVTVTGQPRLVLRQDVDALTASPPERNDWPVRMLYRFDPYLLAHKDKSWVVDAPFYSRIWRPAGHIEGIVLVHGRAAATWRYDRKGRGLVITVSPFQKLSSRVRKPVEKIAPQVAAFFALPLVDLVWDGAGRIL